MSPKMEVILSQDLLLGNTSSIHRPDIFSTLDLSVRFCVMVVRFELVVFVELYEC